MTINRFCSSGLQAIALGAAVGAVGLVVGVALLMASRIPHYSGKSIGRVPREYVIFVLFVVAALLALLATYPMEMLIALSLAWWSLGPDRTEASIDRAYAALALARCRPITFAVLHAEVTR